MATLLLEIGCEELPAAACREAAAQLPELAKRELGAAPDRELATGGIAHVLLDRPDQFVGVEFSQRNTGRDDHQKQQSAETRKHSPENTHAPIVARLRPLEASPPPDNESEAC
jgi:hypothetical protein